MMITALKVAAFLFYFSSAPVLIIGMANEDTAIMLSAVVMYALGWFLAMTVGNK